MAAARRAGRMRVPASQSPPAKPSGTGGPDRGVAVTAERRHRPGVRPCQTLSTPPLPPVATNEPNASLSPAPTDTSGTDLGPTPAARASPSSTVPSFTRNVIASEGWQSRDGNRGLLQQRDRHVAALLAMTNWVCVSQPSLCGDRDAAPSTTEDTAHVRQVDLSSQAPRDKGRSFPICYDVNTKFDADTTNPIQEPPRYDHVARPYRPRRRRRH